MNQSQSINSSHQILESIYQLFSKVGISPVEHREYTLDGYTVFDIVINRTIEEEEFNYIYRELVSSKGLMPIQLDVSPPVVRVLPVPPRRIRRTLTLFLTIATLLTVGITGYTLVYGFREIFPVPPSIVVLETILYIVLFMGALMIHEIGHIIVSKKSSTLIEGPVLVPAPPPQLGFIGTFGAVIFMRTLPPSRRDLAKVGISGPLLGFLAGTIIGLVGLFLSEILPKSLASELMAKGELNTLPVYPLGLFLISFLRPEEGVLVIHPVFFIAYVIYLVTFINLLPIGQLDGGHVVRSFLSSRTHKKVGDITILLLLAASLITSLTSPYAEASFFYFTLSVMAFILRLFVARSVHPGPSNPLSKTKCYICLVVYVILLALTTPIPIY